MHGRTGEHGDPGAMVDLRRHPGGFREGSRGGHSRSDPSLRALSGQEQGHPGTVAAPGGASRQPGSRHLRRARGTARSRSQNGLGGDEPSVRSSRPGRRHAHPPVRPALGALRRIHRRADRIGPQGALPEGPLESSASADHSLRTSALPRARSRSPDLSDLLGAPTEGTSRRSLNKIVVRGIQAEEHRRVRRTPPGRTAETHRLFVTPCRPSHRCSPGSWSPGRRSCPGPSPREWTRGRPRREPRTLPSPPGSPRRSGPSKRTRHRPC